MKVDAYLQSLHFTLLRTQFLLPRRLGFSNSLHARFELVNLLPPALELFAHIVQLVSVSTFCVFDSFVEVELDLTEGFESGDEVVVEDAEVGERFRLCLTVFLLHNHQVISAIETEGEKKERDERLTGVLSTPKILSIY